MTPFVAWATLLLLFALAPVQAPAQSPVKTTPPVSLVDLLVEGQTLYTLAVDKQPENLAAALDLARQAQRAVADSTVRKRLTGGARPDPQDLSVLGALRARISILVDAIPKRREYFQRQYDDIQRLAQRKRFVDARSALDRLPSDAPTADPDFPFAELRADLERTIATAEDYRTRAGTSKALGRAGEAIELYGRAQAIDPLGADYDVLCDEAEAHAEWLIEKRKEIRSLLTSRRLTSAARELVAVQATLPVKARLYEFEVLKAELLQRQQDLSAAVQSAEEAMRAQKYGTAERLWRDAAGIDRDQAFSDQIRRARELGGGKSWVARIFHPDVWLKRPVSQIRALVRAGRR